MLDVLHAVAIKGLAVPSEVSDATGLPGDVVAQQLTALEGAGLVRQRHGRLAGWSVTPAGEAERRARLRELNGGKLAELTSAYQMFLPINTRFKGVCTAWQLRATGAGNLPNDHLDAAYDAAVIEDLTAVHREIEPLLADLAEASPRFALYAGRLVVALRRLCGGEVSAFTAPRRNSYHDVWMELHTDLLAVIGRQRCASTGE